jgi:hypothetical protein
MATGTSLLLIATGAILALAVNYQVTGVNIQTVGGILFVVGIVGLLYSMLFLASFAPFASREARMSVDHDRSHHDHI